MPSKTGKSKRSKKPYERKKKPLSQVRDPCGASTATVPQPAGSQAQDQDGSPGPSHLYCQSGRSFSNDTILAQPGPPASPPLNYPIYHSIAKKAMEWIPAQSSWDYLRYLPFFTEYIPPFLGGSREQSLPNSAVLSEGKIKEFDLEQTWIKNSIQQLAKEVGDSMAEENTFQEIDNPNDKSGSGLVQASPSADVPEVSEPASEEERKEKETLKMLVERRRIEFPGKSVKPVSFSDASPSDFQRLGIELLEPLPPTDANRKILTQLFAVESRKPGFTMEAAMREFLMSTELVLTISELSSRTNDLSEAFARKIIDQFLSTLYKLLRKMALATYEVAEFRIASASAPVEILNARYFTILTGTVDYAFFSSSGRSLRQLRKFGKKIGKGGKRRLSSFAIPGFEDIQVFMLEAKKIDYSESLVVCIPQVGGECVATMKSSGKTSMAWCLSTGSTWIFGIIYNVQGKYVMRWIAPMEFNLRQLHESANVEVVCNIFWALACWMLRPSSTILEKVFAC